MAKKRERQTKTTTEANHWVIMVYLAGDNNLADEMVWSLKSLAESADGKKFDLFARFDAPGNRLPVLHYDFQHEDKKAARRRLFARGKATGADWEGRVADDVKAFIGDSLDRVRTDDPGRLRFMLVLSGHSGGTLGGLLRGDRPGASLGVAELQDVLTYARGRIEALAGRGKELDILGMDSCLMSMAEVCYEIEAAGSRVRYLIGSEGFEMNTGWPYREILGIFREQEGDLPTESVVKEIVRRYLDYYSDYLMAGSSVDLSSCRLYDRTLSESLSPSLRQLSGVLLEGLSKKRVRDAIILAHWRAQSYKWEQYVDLWDFCDLLGMDLEEDPVKSRGKAVREIIEACRRLQRTVEDGTRGLVVECGFRGPAFQHSHGLSIYFPWFESASALAEYQSLTLPKETLWLDFLKAYLRETRRERRRIKGGQPREAFSPDADQEVRSGPLHDVRTGPLHLVRTGPLHNPKVASILAGSMKNPPIEFEATNEDLGPHLLVRNAPRGGDDK